MNGEEMASEKVFVAALEHIKREGLQNLQDELEQNNIDIKINGIRDVQWIMTVPAIWNDEAKDKMLVWMKKAKFIDPNIKDHCLLKYEPDCASLSLQYELLKTTNNIDDEINNNSAETPLIYSMNDNNIFDSDRKDNINYLEGSKYIIIDAGSGTVDIACHQFIENYSVRELYYPTGGPWGDMYIDQAFINILEKLLTKDLLNTIKKDYGNAYFDLLQNFRKIKMEFQNQNDGTYININIPNDFRDAINKKIGIKKFENMVTTFEYNGHKNCFNCYESTVDGYYLNIDCLIWKRYLFNPFVNKVLNHLKELLSKNIMNDCKYIFLVGGYSKTPYFEQSIKNTFGLESTYRINIIIPPRPLFSVVDGAARMGLLQNINRVYISSRVMPRTYGFAAATHYDNINEDDYTKKFLDENTATYEDGKWLLNCFQIIARKGDYVKHDQKITMYGKRKIHTTARIVLYASEERNPKIISDKCVKLREYKITFPKNTQETEIINEFTCKETINAISYPSKFPDRYGKAKITYPHDEQKQGI